MIWIEICGLTLCACGSNAYKEVAGEIHVFKAKESTKMSSDRICISTKSHNFVSERVLAKVHWVNYVVHVHELGTWNIYIIDETLDSFDNLDISAMKKVEDFVDKNSLAYLNDLNDSKETINELASNKIQHPISKENIDHEDGINKLYPSVYSCIKTATPFFKVDERMIWIEICGLTLCACGSNAYKEVAGEIHVFEAEESTKMSSERICISTKSHNFISERVLAKTSMVWKKVEDFVDKNSLAYLNDLNDSKETINELASNKIQHPISKENIDEEDGINKLYPEVAVSSNLIRPSDNSGLIHLPLGGRLFTWMNKAGTKLCKLDRFLISEEVIEALPDVRVTTINHLWLNHNLILLHVSNSDFGPTPFKLFHSWLLHDSFNEVIKTDIEGDENSKFIRVEKIKSFDVFEKARIKWDIEGDENSKFIRVEKIKSFDVFEKARIKWDIEGVWISDPSQIKEEFLNFFKEKFKNHDLNVDFNLFAISSGLCALDRDSLETPVSLDEVNNVILDCGSSKAPGPDGFSFAL
nr:RNA-directed DNA polymerase, eukaryota [Tanacetum cinerariifolium]